MVRMTENLSQDRLGDEELQKEYFDASLAATVRCLAYQFLSVFIITVTSFITNVRSVQTV
jgi:hypothetical protein